jgi:hypothetical protein
MNPRAEAMARLVEMSQHHDVQGVEIAGVVDRNDLTGKPVTRWRCSIHLGRGIASDGVYLSARHNTPELAVEVIYHRFLRRTGGAHG